MVGILSYRPFKKFSFAGISLSKVDFAELLDLSAALAFYMTLSLSPLIVLILAALNALDINLQEKFLEQVAMLSGPGGAAVIAQLMDSGMSKASALTSQLLGVLVLLVSSSAIFGQLRQSLDHLFFGQSTPEGESKIKYTKLMKEFLRARIFHIGLVISFILVLIVSLIASSYLIYLTQAYLVSSVYKSVVTGLSFLIFAIYFFLMFYFIPSRKIPMRLAVLGGLATAVLFMIGKSIIGLYIGTMGVGSTFGAAGTIIVLMAWVYYSSWIIFLCAKGVSMITLKPQKEHEP
ncbi:MAG: YihY/virulence factor BrkB family protein [Bdellovibrionota bacterium]